MLEAVKNDEFISVFGKKNRTINHPVIRDASKALKKDVEIVIVAVKLSP